MPDPLSAVGKAQFFFDRTALTKLALLVQTARTGLSSALVDASQFIQAITMNLIIVTTFGVTGAQVGAVCISALSGRGHILYGNHADHAADRERPVRREGLHGPAGGDEDRLFHDRGFMIAIVVLLEVFARPFGRVFNVTSPEAVALLDTAFRLYLLSLPLVGAQECLRVTLQATDRENTASVLTGCAGTICFVPVIWLLARFSPMLLWLSFST